MLRRVSSCFSEYRSIKNNILFCVLVAISGIDKVSEEAGSDEKVCFSRYQQFITYKLMYDFFPFTSSGTFPQSPAIFFLFLWPPGKIPTNVGPNVSSETPQQSSHKRKEPEEVHLHDKDPKVPPEGTAYFLYSELVLNLTLKRHFSSFLCKEKEKLMWCKSTVPVI